MNETWKKIWSKRHSIRLSECWCYGALGLKGQHGVAFPNQRIEIENSFGTGYVDEEGYRTMLEHFVGRIRREGFDAVLGMAETEYHAFLAYAKTLQPEALAILTTADLSATFQEFLRREDHWMNFMWPVFALDEGLTPEFQKYTESLPENERDEVVRLALTPERQTAAAQYHTDVLELLIRKPSEEEKRAAVVELARTYAYFPILNMDEELMKESDVAAMIDRLAAETPDPGAELAKEKTAEEECAIAFAAHIAKLPNEERNLLVAVKRVGYLREYRNDVRQEAYMHARELYREIGRRAGLALGDIIYCTRPELSAYLSEGKSLPTKADIEKRRGYSRIYCDGTTVVVSFEKDEKSAREVADVSELKGTVAFKGRVVGTARIILDVAREGGKFREGDILVSTTTNLAFVPLMGKAAAFVTEEGGLLTHTAIVARELKKPCIIGTKIATQVLKDGDVVEVDADSGVVRILERAQAVSRSIYQKAFTRDFSLPIVQIWCRAESTHAKLWTEKKQPYMPFLVFEKLPLGVACYMDTRGVGWLKQELVELAKRDPEFVARVEKEFTDAYDNIRQRYISKGTLTREQFSEFFRELEQSWSWFEAGWWLWEMQPEERPGLELPESLFELRNRTQDLVADADRVVRESVAKLFPEYAEYADLISGEEIISKDIPPRAILETRRRSYFVTADTLFAGVTREDIESRFGITLEHFETPSQESFRGHVAFPGKVTGTAKLVSSPRNMDKVQEGDILVSPMTLPDILPAMKKAAAFVTDEGGIMCHAAITARELKKPCIIGTKIATQVLKDGDMVEVDADAGIVRKI